MIDAQIADIGFCGAPHNKRVMHIKFFWQCTAAWSRRKLFYAELVSSPYSIAERRVPELIPVLGSQPAGDVSHKPGGRLPSLSARPAVTPATFKRAATNIAAW